MQRVKEEVQQKWRRDQLRCESKSSNRGRFFMLMLNVASLKTPHNDRSLALLPIQPADVVWGTGDCRPCASHALFPGTIHRSR
jgi:hypothetical protein